MESPVNAANANCACSAGTLFLRRKKMGQEPLSLAPSLPAPNAAAITIRN